MKTHARIFLFLFTLCAFCCCGNQKTRMTECTYVTRGNANLVHKDGNPFTGTAWSNNGTSSIKCTNGMISSLNGYFSSGKRALKIQPFGNDATLYWYSLSGKCIMTQKVIGFFEGESFRMRPTIYDLNGENEVDFDSPESKKTIDYLQDNGAQSILQNLIKSFSNELEHVR